MKNRRIEPWRVAVAIISILFIIIIWVKKDIGSALVGIPNEQIVPMIVTSVAVTLLKILAIAGAVFLIKWICHFFI